MQRDAGLPVAPLPPLLPDAALAGARVALLGLGIEGRDLGRFLAGRGARVTAFDSRPRSAVAAAADELEALGCFVQTGASPAAGEASEFDALYASQSVLLQRDPFAGAFIDAGKPVGSMLREFLRRWRGPTLGITGSSGKTTTTSLVAAIVAAAGRPHIVGGNLGAPLLAQLDQQDERLAILEISHTQLQLFDGGLNTAAITNVTPNHLDQFSWEGYVALKRRILAGGARLGDLAGSMTPTAVLNADDPISAAFAAEHVGEVVRFSRAGNAAEFSVEQDWIVQHVAPGAGRIVRLDEIPLRGLHNVENVLAACAAVWASGLGIDCEVYARAIRDFTPVPHRLELVASIGGVAWYNDSIATAPERTLAAIRAFDRGERVVLLLGGREKKLPLDDLIDEAAVRARGVVFFGEAEPVFADAFERAEVARSLPLVRASSLANAVAAAAELAQSGDVVLLSPAGTSFDAYPNFERRGEEFRALVQAMVRSHGSEEAR
jgi:UDP-N-acetylmuramoylalanine--D-glutamate ligase